MTWELVSASRFGVSEVHIEALYEEYQDIDFLLIQLDTAYVEVRDELIRRNSRGRNE